MSWSRQSWDTATAYDVSPMDVDSPAIVIHLTKNNERKSYRLEYSGVLRSWYYVSSLLEDPIEILPSLQDAIAKRALIDGEVTQLRRQGWSHVPISTT